MAKPFGLFDQPARGVASALVLPWPFGYAEHQIVACRDDQLSSVLLRSSDGTVALAEMPTFLGQSAASMSSAIDLGSVRGSRANLTIAEALDPRTWNLEQQCDRKTTRMWLYDRAGFGTATPPGRRGWDRGVQAFQRLLAEKLISEARALVLGERPQVSAILAANLHWRLASVHYLYQACGDVELRRRAQALQLADALGLTIPLAKDGLHFDSSDPLIRHLEYPNAHEEQLASRLQCSVPVVRHVLRRRELFAGGHAGGHDEATQRQLIKALDATSTPTHLPRTEADLQAHGSVLRYAARLSRLEDCTDGWIRFAYQQNATSTKAAERLKELLAVCDEIASDIWHALAASDEPTVGDPISEARSLFAKLIQRGAPSRLAQLRVDVYQQAHQAMSNAVTSRAMRQLGFGQAWDCVEHLLAPLSAWSGPSMSAGLHFRGLTSVPALIDWGKRAGNCLDIAWAVCEYLSRLRLLFAVEIAQDPHLPVATLSVASCSQDLAAMLPPWNSDRIAELKLARRLDDMGATPREQMTESVRLAFQDLGRTGQALWDDSVVMMRWHEAMAPWVAEFNAQKSQCPIGRYLPQAIRDEYIRTTGTMPDPLHAQVTHA